MKVTATVRTERERGRGEESERELIKNDLVIRNSHLGRRRGMKGAGKWQEQ